MKCNHGLSITKCDPCLTRILKHLIRKDSSSSEIIYKSGKSSCKSGCKKTCKCYANAFITTPGQSQAPILRTLTQEELASNCGITVELTANCGNSLLQLGKCKSPQNKWCKIVDRENKFVTSVQVPKGCGGCYNFDLSASVALTGLLTFNLLGVFGTPPVTTLFDFTNLVSIPATVDLRLAEQLPRQVCVADEISETPEACFTAVTFPIIDTPSATVTLAGDLGGTLLDVIFTIIFSVGLVDLGLTNALFRSAPAYSNLAVSGTVCLKDCQRLVPTLLIRSLTIQDIFDPLSALLPANISITSVNLSNIQLSLSTLSLKLVRVGDCAEDCDCKARPRD